MLRDNASDNVFNNIFPDPFLDGIGGVLGGNDHSVNSDSLLAVVFDCDLGFGIGPEIRHQLRLLLSYRGESLNKMMGKQDWHRHILGCIAACISKHHSLITRTAGVHTALDIEGLGMNGRNDRAGIGIESHSGFRVSYVPNNPADDLLYFNIAIGCDLAANQSESCRNESLACDS